MDPVVEASAFIAHRWHKPTESRTSTATASLQGATHVLDFHNSKRDKHMNPYDTRALRSHPKPPQRCTSSPNDGDTLFAYQPLFCDEFMDAQGVLFSMSKTPRERSPVAAVPKASRKRPQSATVKRVTSPPVAMKNVISTARLLDEPTDDPVATMIYRSPGFKQRSLQALEAETYRLLDHTRSVVAWESVRAPCGPALSVVRMRNDGNDRGISTTGRHRPSLQEVDRACHCIYKFVCRQYLRRKRDRFVRALQASHPDVREFSDGVIVACRMFSCTKQAKRSSHRAHMAVESSLEAWPSNQASKHSNKPAKKGCASGCSSSKSNPPETMHGKDDQIDAGSSNRIPPKRRKGTETTSARCTLARSDPLRKLRCHVVRVKAARRADATSTSQSSLHRTSVHPQQTPHKLQFPKIPFFPTFTHL
ncbi:hypothetical protein H310_08449 [Aphanomyces invadans]|uniref:Uncharacterized protein n=1 Tax=Aphanomyces invadans TaxID=157072 RepID=A0A024TY93_9STRA|nr:hypothetical protein H310_08449 [Aphanomyces invadans]ETV98973.1 hypothetical protein H310_08449 [Aphanomyces invadans]|eukprot:XP_008872401.1 hypothetical protein H310_08449 [Aphanomyces invadans]